MATRTLLDTDTLKWTPVGAGQAQADVQAGFGQCRLVLSGGNLSLDPVGGNLLTIGGVARKIAAASA